VSPLVVSFRGLVAAGAAASRRPLTGSEFGGVSMRMRRSGYSRRSSSPAPPPGRPAIGIIAGIIAPPIGVPVAPRPQAQVGR
jgi:hypothetical protein